MKGAAMGDKQIHPPHGQGAFGPSEPSGDAVQGSQVTGVVSNPPAAKPDWQVQNDQAMKDSLQKGLDRELDRIKELEGRLEGSVGAEREAIESSIKQHKDFADLLRRQAKERGWVLSENSPARVGNNILKAAAALVGAAVLVITGAFFASRLMAGGELVADTPVSDGFVDEAPETESVNDGDSEQAEDEGQGAGMVDGPRVMVEPVHEQHDESQVQTETQVEERHSSEPVQDDTAMQVGTTMQDEATVQDEPHSMEEEPEDSAQYPEDGYSQPEDE